MKVKLIKWHNVVQYCRGDKKIERAFKKFHFRLVRGDFNTPQDLVKGFGNSDLVTCIKTGNTRIVFNVGSNKYRMICGYYFAPKWVILYIKFVGTHKEYDDIDVCKIDQFKSK